MGLSAATIMGGRDFDAAGEQPRRWAGAPRPGEVETLPTRQADGSWKRTYKKKKQTEPEDEDGEYDTAQHTEPVNEIEAAAAEVESAAETRAKIAKLSAQILEAPHKHIGLVGDLLQVATGWKTSPPLQRLALLSASAVLRDLIPAYRVRLPTEKELKMQVTKEVSALRDFEAKLLSHYERCVQLLTRWSSGAGEANKAAGVRGLAALLDKAYDFNHREALIAALVPVANCAHAPSRADACSALVRLFANDSQGDATLEAVRVGSNLLKHSSFNVEPELLATWLHLKVDAATANTGAEPASKKAKKRKRTLDPVARELAAAAGERGNLAHMQGRILEQVFVSYARVVKRGAHSPLLPAVLRGVAKFAHQVNVELLLDLFSNLRVLLSLPVGDGGLSESAALQCVHALLQLLSGHGAALAVDSKDVQLKLYSLLASRTLLEQPTMLATALDCVEHLCKRNRTALLASRAASIVRRLLGVACTAPPAQAIATICACSRLMIACPRLGTMLESPEGSAPLNLALLGGGESLEGGMESGDIDSTAALHSTLWQLTELRRHYHPTVSELAGKLINKESFPARFHQSTPIGLMNAYSDAQGAFHPAPQPPRAHRLAAAAEEAAKSGAPAPTLGVVGASKLAAVRQAEAEALAAVGKLKALPFAQGRLR